MSDFKAKCTKFDFGWGSTQTILGELTALSRPSSCDALLLRGGKGEGEGKEGKGKGGKGTGQGKNVFPRLFNPTLTTVCECHMY